MKIYISIPTNKMSYSNNHNWHNSYGPDGVWTDGHITYHQNNALHNIHGPAIIYPDGTNKHYLDGIQYSKEDWKKKRHEY